MKNTTRLPLQITYGLLIAVVFILPFFSSDNYSILRNTTSHLGGQNMPNAWVMNLTFVLLGITVVWAGWKFLGNFWLHKILLLGFGLSLILVAVYSHAPIDPRLSSNEYEDFLHSVFAKTTGWTFTILAGAMIFIVKSKFHKILAGAIAIFVTLLSLMMFWEPTTHLMGIWQRMIFLSSFAWLIYVFGKYELTT